MRFRPILPLILLPLLALACGDDGGPAEPAAPVKVVTESANAASKTVGLSGGTIVATASDGTRYTLVIPEGAIAKPTKITMTPVTSIAGLPVLKDAVAAGLDFKPSGLVFANPLTLTIEGPTPAASEIPIAVSYQGNAEKFALELAAMNSGKIVVLIRHFSGFGLDFGTDADLASALEALPFTADASVCALEVFQAFNADPSNEALLFDIMDRWFADTILPQIDAATDDEHLVLALNDYNFWRRDAFLAVGIPIDIGAALPDLVAQAQAAFIPKLQDAIAGNNELCKAAQSLDALRNVIFWQKQAEQLEVATVSNGLDADTVRASLCARLVIEDVALPTNMQVGFPHSLDFRLLLKFSDGTTLNVPSAVSIQATNATVDNPAGNTDPFGNYTTVITATADGAISVIITGNAIMPGELTLSIIDETFIVNASAGVDLSGTWTGTVEVEGLVPPEPACLVITQNQNAISGTLHQFGGTATFSGTLASDNQILGVTIDGFVGDANCILAGRYGQVVENFFDGQNGIALSAVIDGFCDSQRGNRRFLYVLSRGGTCP